VSTFGVIVGNRGIFPRRGWRRDGREEILARCSGAAGPQDLLPDAGKKVSSVPWKPSPMHGAARIFSVRMATKSTE